MNACTWKSSSAVGGVVLVLGIVASGCSGEVAIGAAPPGSDSGMRAKPDGGIVAQEREAGTDAPKVSRGEAGQAPDAPNVVDGGSPTAPKLVQSGADLILFGVTSDGYAIYSVATLSPTLLAAPLAGGPVMTIGTVMSESFFVQVIGSVVLVYDNIQQTDLSTLSIWSAAGGFHTITSSTLAYTATADPSSKAIAYLENYDAQAGTADAYVSQSDSTGATLLQSGITGLVALQACYPELAFTGGSVALSYCTSSSPVATGNIYTFAPPSWQATSIAQGTEPFLSLDPTGKNLLIYGMSGMQVVPVSGGTPTLINAEALAGVFTHDGGRVVYVTSTGALRVSPIASPSPATLVASGVQELVELSPDDSSILVSKSYNASTYQFDLYAASTATAGPLEGLNTTATSKLLYGSQFTGDSSHALFFSNVGSTYVGTLAAAQISPQKMSPLATASSTVWASGKTRVVYGANTVTPPGSSITNVDIMVADVSAATAPVKVVSSANVNGAQAYAAFFLSPAGDKVVYTQNAAGGLAAGLFVTAVP